MSTRPNSLTGQPQPPPGFVLDSGPGAGRPPAPPPGFVLDAQQTQPDRSLRERINEKLASPDPSEQRPMLERAAYGVGRALMAPINLGREVFAPAETPEEIGARSAAPLFPQAGVIAERLALRPMRETASAAGKSWAEGKPVSAARQIVAASVPVAGPMVEGLYEQAVERGDVAGTVTELASGVYMGARGPKAAVKAGNLVKQGVSAAIAPVKGVAQMLRAPKASHAMNQAIQPSVTIPNAVRSIEAAGPELQRVRAQRGVEIRDTGVKGEAMKAHAENVIATKRAIWDEYEQRLKPYEGFYEQTQDVAQAMQKAVDARIRSQYPAVAAKIDKRAATYNRMMTLREIEEHIQSANNELSNWYKKSAADPGSVAPNIEATVAEVQTLRRLLDRKLNSFTGEHISEFKKLYGALRDVERATARQMFVQARQKGATLYEALSGISAIGDVIGASPWGAFKAAGKLAIGKRLAQLRNADYLIEQAYHGKNAFPEAQARTGFTAPPMAQPVPLRPPAGLLPGPTYTQAPPPAQMAAPNTATSPAVLPPHPVPQLSSGRVIEAPPARTGPPPMTAAERPPAVDVSKATVQAWPKQLSISELRAEANILRKKAASIRQNAARMKNAQRAQKWSEEADVTEARARQIDAAIEQRLKPTGRA